LVVCAILAGTLSGRSPSGQPGSGLLVFTQLPRQTEAEKLGAFADGMLPQPYGERATIVIWQPGAKPRPLVKGFHSSCDPQLSFDGGKVLFAGKKTASDAWDIFEVGVDGTGLRQVTKNMGNCRNPIYQGTLFTLDSKEPWYQVSFVSDLAQELNEYGPFPAVDLYSCKLDGTELRRLTFNPSSDLSPWILPDGRMVYAAWQLSTADRGRMGRVALHAVNIDGTDNNIFAGDEGLRVKHMPCVTANRLVVFVESDRLPWDGAGRLSYVTLRRNLHSHHAITTEKDGLFLSPSPLPDGQILVSRRDSDKQKTHGIYRLDPESGRMELLYDDPKYHDIQAKAVTPRAVPDGRSTVVLESEPTAKIYCLDFHISDLAADKWIKPPSNLKLRVLEGLPRKARAGSEPSALSSSITKRFLGEINVDPDGSFNIQVPANIPIQLQLVDSHGMALRASHWIWAKNKEHRGCIGCHEDNELTPPNKFVSALSRNSTPLLLPEEHRRSVDFRRDVMPIVARKCATAACHSSPTAAVKLNASLEPAGGKGMEQQFNRSYLSLMASAGGAPGAGEAFKYVHPGKARTSPLIWHLFGRNTSQAWDASYKSAYPVKPMPPSGEAALTDMERRTFVEWIDLGALWDGFQKSAGGSR